MSCTGRFVEPEPKSAQQAGPVTSGVLAIQLKDAGNPPKRNKPPATHLPPSRRAALPSASRQSQCVDRGVWLPLVRSHGVCHSSRHGVYATGGELCICWPVYHSTFFRGSTCLRNSKRVDGEAPLYYYYGKACRVGSFCIKPGRLRVSPAFLPVIAWVPFFGRLGGRLGPSGRSK